MPLEWTSVSFGSVSLYIYFVLHVYVYLADRDKVSRFIWICLANILQKEIITQYITYFVIFKSYRFLGPVFGDLSEEPLPEDVQVVRDAQSSASRIVPHRKTIP